MTDKNKDKIDPLLLKLLCCPACKDSSELQLADNELVCSECSRKYALREVPGPDNSGMLIPDLILLDS